MKTAEHYLMRWRDNEFELYELIELVQKDSFKEGQSNPKIKQLEWEKSLFFEGDFEAKCSLGLNDYKYYINLKDDHATLSLRSNSQIIVLGSYSRPNEAKAAAQADFEKRVKNFLVT